MHGVDGDALGAFKTQKFGEPPAFDLRARQINRLDGRVDFRRALHHASGQAAANIGVAVQQGGEHGKGFVGRNFRCWHMRQHGIQQRVQIFAGLIQFAHAPAVATGGVKDRKIELFVIGIQRDEQVEHFIDHRIGASVGAVDLIDHHDWAQTLFQRFAQHKLGLRHWPFCGIGQQNDAVGHAQHALNLAAEIGMSGCVDNIDARVVPHHGSRLGKDCNAALLFQIAGIHQPFFDMLIVAEQAGLLHDRVDERRLAMVNMGDDCDIPQHLRLFIGRNGMKFI